jgi:hypothetical protein
VKGQILHKNRRDYGAQATLSFLFLPERTVKTEGEAWSAEKATKGREESILGLFCRETAKTARRAG